MNELFNAIAPQLPDIIDMIVMIVGILAASFFTVATMYLPPFMRAFIRQKDIDTLVNAITRYVRRRLLDGVDMAGPAAIMEAQDYINDTMPDLVKKRQPSIGFIEATIKEAVFIAPDKKDPAKFEMK